MKNIFAQDYVFHQLFSRSVMMGLPEEVSRKESEENIGHGHGDKTSTQSIELEGIDNKAYWNLDTHWIKIINIDIENQTWTKFNIEP